MPLQLIVDTNLAVLLFVGMGSKKGIGKHKRLQAYDETDFDILKEVADEASELIFCPNVLSETSNLIRYMSGPNLVLATNVLVQAIQNYQEIYVPSVQVGIRPEFGRLGLTDSVLLEMVGRGMALITDDLDLYLAAVKISKNVINFSHLRELRADFR